MRETKTHRDDGARPASAVRRLVGLERHYRCRACAAEHRSWSRLGACFDCGEPMTTAVIRRAALVAGCA